MALDSKSILGCPYCGYRVNPVDTSCPRCGNGFDDLTKFECPFCGDMVPAGRKECPSCHIDFAEFVAKSASIVSDEGVDAILLDIINMESSRVKHEEMKFSCPKCSWMLEGTETTCPKCGEDLSKDSNLQCPICGAFVKAVLSKCPECGTPFGPETAALEYEIDDRHEKISSALSGILDSIAETEPAPEPEQAPPQTPPEPEEEPEPEEPASQTTPKKTKQRKLKTRRPGNKPA
jgi:RNA polymerase subunit RPABC4/transcription elongation factor Spt4